MLLLVKRGGFVLGVAVTRNRNSFANHYHQALGRQAVRLASDFGSCLKWLGVDASGLVVLRDVYNCCSIRTNWSQISPGVARSRMAAKAAGT